MCGFFFNTASDYIYNLESNILRFNKLKHRGVDNSSYEEIQFNKKIFLGHHRLSINDLDNRSHQPMKSLCQKYYILFNGEIFNFKKLKEEINYQFKTHSDTEVILAGYKIYGKDFLKKLEGFFSILLIDIELKKIIITVDPTSNKSVYYERSKESLSIASELNSFIPTKKSQIIKNISSAALGVYLQYGYIHAPYSIYKNIYKLEPGELIEFDINQFDATHDKNFNKHFSNKSFKDFDQLIIDSHKSRLVSDVPIATMLSGGVDSTLTNIIYKKFINNSEKVFTLGIQDSTLDESEIALKQTKKWNLNHHIININKADIVKEFKNVSNFLDEPFADSSSILVSLLSKEISKEYKVVISSDGGDELLYGYSRHRFYKIFHRLINLPRFLKKFLIKILLTKIIKKLFNFIRISHVDLKINKILSFLNQDNKLNAYFSLLKITPDFISDKLLLSYQGDTLIKHYDGKLKSIKDIDYNFYLPSINFKNDRCGMQYCLEIREPMLNFDIVRHFYGNIMSIIDLIYPKKLFRYYLKKNRTFVQRKKHGFSFSQKEILEFNNYELISYLEKNLKLISDLFNINFILQMIDEFKRQSKWTTELWILLSFAIWLKNKVE